jgi:putative tryptophan/tyrosine transport system substrate-binding protein
VKAVTTQWSGVRKSGFVFALCAVLGALCGHVEAQQPKKVPRIAFLAGGSRSGDSLLIETFWQRMKELGYSEGKNITAEYRFAEGVPERLSNFAAELVRLNVDVIVAPGSGARAAKKATDTIPIVITYGDPVGDGLVASLARPGGNVTGLSGFVSELGGKQLELLKEAFPKVSRVAVLWWTDQNALMLGDIKLAAGPVRVTIQPLELRDIRDLEPAFSAITERADGMITMRNTLTATHRKRIVGFAGKSRLPAIYPDGEFVDAGGLMSYGVSVPDLWGRAAVYVDKILKRAKPADLPVEQPTKFELIINFKTAKQIGLTIPPSVLARADRVIK